MPSSARRNRLLARHNTARQQQPNRRRMFLESLEDRRMMAGVTINDIIGSGGYISTLSNSLDSAIDGVAVLDNQVPGLSETLKDANELKQQIDAVNTGLQAIVGSFNPSDDGDTVAYLNAVTAANNGVTISAIDDSQTDKLLFTIRIQDSRTTNVSLDTSLEDALPLDVGLDDAGLPLQLANQIDATFRVEIDKTQSGADRFRFIPNASGIDYSPTLTLAPQTLDGRVAGKLEFAASVGVALSPTFEFDFANDSSSRPLSAIATSLAFNPATDIQNPTITTRFNATLDASGPIPEFAFNKDFVFDFANTSMATNESDDPTVLIKIDNVWHDVTTAAGREAVIRQVLGTAGETLFDQLQGIVPANVRDLLLGSFQVFGGQTFRDLTGARPIDFLNLVGVPEPIPDILAKVLEASAFADTLGTVDEANEGNLSAVSDSADQLGVKFPIFDDVNTAGLAVDPAIVISNVVKLFKGEVIDIATWSVNLTQHQVFDNPAVRAAFVKPIEVASGGTVDGIVVQQTFDSQDVKNRLKDAARSALGDVAGDAVGFLIDNVPGDVKLDIDFAIAANLTLGVDTSFLSNPTLGGVTDSFFIDTLTPLFTTIIDVSLTASAGTDGTIVGDVLGAGGAVVDSVECGLFGSCDDGAQESASKALSASMTIATEGSFTLALKDSDGKIRLSEIADIAERFKASGGLFLTVAGEADLLGVSGSFGPKKYSLVPPFDAGVSCVDNSGGATSAMPDNFAELSADGVLQIYGSTNSDIITIDLDSGGMIVVSRGSGTLTFDPADVNSIAVDLRGGQLTRVNPGTDPANGGNDYVFISPFLASSLTATVWAGSGNDVVTAHDILYGFFGGELTVYGGDGNDTLTGGGGLSILEGEGDNDHLRAGTGMSALVGGSGNDRLVGLDDTSGLQTNTSIGVMEGGDGDDVLIVGEISRGNFLLVGGTIGGNGDAGRNLIVGGHGNDVLMAGNADDSGPLPTAILESGDSSILVGGPGLDRLYGSQQGDILVGGAIGGWLHAGYDEIYGGSGEDYLLGGNIIQASNSLGFAVDLSNGGQALMEGGAGDDRIYGGRDADLIKGQGGDDTIESNAGDDVIAFDVGGHDTLDAGAPSASDALYVDFAAATEFVVIKQSRRPDEGVVRVYNNGVFVASLSFVDTEVVSANVFEGPLGPQVLSMRPDLYEQNEFRSTAADLGTAATVQVTGQIFPPTGEFPLFPNLPTDQDYFRYKAAHTGTLELELNYRHITDLLPGHGDIDVRVRSSSGAIIASSLGTSGTERISIPVVKGQTYYVQVFGDEGIEINAYDFTLTNTPAPVPLIVDLQAASDSGRSATDNITNDTTPTLDIYLDDDQVDALTNLDLQPGVHYFVDVFNNGVLLGTATFQGPSAGVNNNSRWQFTADAGDLQEGHNNFLTAAVRVVDAAGQAGRTSFSTALAVTLDTLAPAAPVLNLAPGSDTGAPSIPGSLLDRITSATTASFRGSAELEALIRLYADGTANGAIDFPAVFASVGVGTTGQWTTPFAHDLNDLTYFTRDGLREIATRAEDIAGNVSLPSSITIFVDTQGPQIFDPAGNVGALFIPDIAGTAVNESFYPLFNPAGANGPTPVVSRIGINIRDLANRANGFLPPALWELLAENVANFQLLGDHSGRVLITGVDFAANAAVVGQAATGTILLTFASPLPDDRFTLSITGGLLDPSGNSLDGDSNAAAPTGTPTWPSGDGTVGGIFSARFTVDSRPEVAVFSQGAITTDLNSNFRFDSLGSAIDAAHRDVVFQIGTISDHVFAGQFEPAAIAQNDNDGFDKLGAYGYDNVAKEYRFLLDLDHNGTFDVRIRSRFQVNAIPVAGNFAPGRAGDEIGLFDGQNWYLDTNGDNDLDTRISTTMIGLPIVGDFNGDGADDLATYDPATNVFAFDLDRNGTINDSFTLDQLNPAGLDNGFGVDNGYNERPFTGDWNLDGIDDLGLVIPARAGSPTEGQSDWYMVVSDVTGQALPRNVFAPYAPSPLGNDVSANFGGTSSLPLFGNFDPPAEEAPPAQTIIDATPGEWTDVNSDGYVTPLDALLIINWLNNHSNRQWEIPSPDAQDPYLDVDGNLQVTPLDALIVINRLNAASFFVGSEGEAADGEEAEANEPITAIESHSLDFIMAVMFDEDDDD